jgi:hypothetical protein
MRDKSEQQPPRPNREHQADGEIHAEHANRELRDPPHTLSDRGQIQRWTDGAGIERVREAHRDHNTNPPQHRVVLAFSAALEGAVEGAASMQP